MADYRPTLHLQRCILRPTRTSDAAAVRAAADDPEVVRFLRDRFPHPFDDAAVANWMRLTRAEGLPEWKEGDPDPAPSPPTTMILAICLPDDTLIGCIGLHPTHDDKTERCTRELGYWLGRKYWGRGIVGEAAHAITRWALSPAGSALVPTGEQLERIHGAASADNIGSAKVMERCGFVREGVLRRAILKRDAFTDLIVFGLLRSDVEAADAAKTL